VGAGAATAVGGGVGSGGASGVGGAVGVGTGGSVSPGSGEARLPSRKPLRAKSRQSRAPVSVVVVVAGVQCGRRPGPVAGPHEIGRGVGRVARTVLVRCAFRHVAECVEDLVEHRLLQIARWAPGVAKAFWSQFGVPWRYSAAA
jgi:hypothetical protein